MRFNKDQREGLAKVLDNIATAFIIGVTIGSVTDHKIAPRDGIFLLAFASAIIAIAVTLRGVKETSDVH